MSSHRGMGSRPPMPALFSGLMRRPKAGGGGKQRRSASRHQAEEPARDRADARGGASRRQGARPGSPDGASPA